MHRVNLYKGNMEWLNYHHLYYFWLVSKEESITRAAKILRLSQPSVSSQIKSLERSLNVDLFNRVGKRLVLTDQGRLVFRYADEIFSTGQEMIQSLKGQTVNRPVRLHIGLDDVVPKLFAYRLIQIALDQVDKLEIHCKEGKSEQLLHDLSLHHLDIVITDVKISSLVASNLYEHLIGQCGISFFAGKKIVKKYGSQFPECLHAAPLLLPAKESSVRQELERWLRSKMIIPRLVGEFDDSALMKVFGQFNNGFFYGPTILEKEINNQYKVTCVGRLPKIKESLYAITAERKIVHPAVIAMTSQARQLLFHQ